MVPNNRVLMYPTAHADVDWDLVRRIVRSPCFRTKKGLDAFQAENVIPDDEMGVALIVAHTSRTRAAAKISVMISVLIFASFLGHRLLTTSTVRTLIPLILFGALFALMRLLRPCTSVESWFTKKKFQTPQRLGRTGYLAIILWAVLMTMTYLPVPEPQRIVFWLLSSLFGIGFGMFLWKR